MPCCVPLVPHSTQSVAQFTCFSWSYFKSHSIHSSSAERFFEVYRILVAGATKFCTVAANVMIGGPQWIFLHASLLTSGILGWRLHFSKSRLPQNCRLCLFDFKMFLRIHKITDFFSFRTRVSSSGNAVCSSNHCHCIKPGLQKMCSPDID